MFPAWPAPAWRENIDRWEQTNTLPQCCVSTTSPLSYTYLIGSSSPFSLLWDGNFDQYTGQKHWAWAPDFSKLPFSEFLAKLLCTNFTYVMGMANVIHNAINIIHNNLWFMTSFKQFMTLFKQLWMTLWKTQRATIL